MFEQVRQQLAYHNKSGLDVRTKKKLSSFKLGSDPRLIKCHKKKNKNISHGLLQLTSQMSYWLLLICSSAFHFFYY